MKKNINLYPILLLLVFITICLVNTTFAVDLGQGEIISRVNLRQAPGLHGKVITGIQRGTLVLVKDRQGDWFRIIVSGETYGYEGWIYAKYLRFIAETENRDDSMEVPTIGAAPAIPVPDAIEESAALQNAEPLVNQGSASADEPVNSDSAIYTQPSEELVKKSVNSAKKIKNKKEIYHREKINKTQSEFSDNNKTSKAPAKTISLIKEKEMGKKHLISDSDNSYKENTGWLRLILKFASVILSCFAILLSYKALQFAKETREMVMQLKGGGKK